MEKINVAELLKDCPKGMELDCTMYENVTFVEVCKDINALYPIYCITTDEKGNRSRCSFTKNGYASPRNSAKCVIYPKGKTTWEGFQRPFKDGDIIFTHANCLKVGLGNTWISIFQEKRNGGVATHVDYAEDGDGFYSYNEDKGLLCMEEDVMRQRFASEEEKAKLFQAIKDNGYKWNEETKTLEKLTPDKFDINTLKPFESRVLIRDHKLQKWSPAIWGFYDSDSKDYPYKLVGIIARYCIPYEGNQHLLSTTNDCDEYFKTWE